MPTPKDWGIGSICWTHLPAQPGRHRGRIVGAVSAEGITAPIYLVQMDRRDWMTLECRDATLLSRAEDETPPVWKAPK